MESPKERPWEAHVIRDPAGAGIRADTRAERRPATRPALDSSTPLAAVSPFPAAQFGAREFDMWRDVFVSQPLPWKRIVESWLLHGVAIYLICTIALSWVREQNILEPSGFDRSSLVTYSPSEYLPPLDTGGAKPVKQQMADPVYAPQPIHSVPPEADNRSQTIVVPPDVKLDHDVPLPNIVALGAVAPTVPLDATRARLSRSPEIPDQQVVAPAPEVAAAANRTEQTPMTAEVIAPPPDVTPTEKGRAGVVNIGPSDVVAPAPQLTLEEQHTPAARRGGRLASGGVQPVAPPPSVATGSGNANGRLIALGIHPVVPTGPVVVPPGNRRGTFAASPKGKPGASGAPDSTGSNAGAQGASAGRSGNGGSGFGTRKNGLPPGLRVDSPDSADDPREVASLSKSGSGSAAGAGSKARVASPVADDKMTDVDRKVFGGKRVYGRMLNMPNLNSASGSWVIKFAELGGGKKDGELLEPVALEKTDPGYPLELMRANVHGMVTLYAVIHADGRVGDIRVLMSEDERLDSFAEKALARWKFLPAERAGKPVTLEAVVTIPFRARQNF